MIDDQEFIEYYFNNQLSDLSLPPAIDNKYNLISCLGKRENHSSYLVCNKKTAIKYVLKIGTPEYSEQMREECSQLNLLYQELKEKAYSIEEMAIKPNYCYFLRPYVEGESIEAYTDRLREPIEEEILQIAINLSESIDYFHRQNPPLIHRDIKPNNIVIKPTGEVVIIDFDAARRYNKAKKSDTQYFGSEGTAAPEQYGYSQTDERTDIFAFGRVLCYMFTQEFEIEACKDICSPGLYHIIKKCCTFSPSDRYASIRDVTKALKREKRRTKLPRGIKWGFRAIAMGVVLSGILLTVFYFGKAAKENPADQHELSEEVQFDTIAMRRGVTYALGIGEKDKVTYGDLQNITSLFIVCDGYYQEKEFQNISTMLLMHNLRSKMWAETGYIKDLSICAHMPRLKRLFIYGNQVMDISALRGLQIEVLCLQGNDIRDFSVLEDMTSLQELYIGDNPLEQLPDLHRLDQLQILNIDYTSPKNLTALEDTQIKHLSLKKVNTSGYTSLEKMKKLRNLELCFPEEAAVSTVSRLSQLEQLTIWAYCPSMGKVVFSGLHNLKEITVTCVQEDPFDIDSIAEMQGLERVLFGDCAIINTSNLLNMKNLKYIMVNEKTIADDYTPFCKEELFLLLDEDIRQWVLDMAGLTKEIIQ